MIRTVWAHHGLSRRTTRPLGLEGNRSIVSLERRRGGQAGAYPGCPPRHVEATVTTERNLRRSELYALVWSKPVQQVAADIGVSGVAVAKACRRHGIPVPARGSWARQRYGHRVKQPPLPALPDGSEPIISFRLVSIVRPGSAALVGRPGRTAAGEPYRGAPDGRAPAPSGAPHASHALEVQARRERVARHVCQRLLQRQRGPIAVGADLSGPPGACRRGRTAWPQNRRGRRARSGLRVEVDGEVLKLAMSERLKRQPWLLLSRMTQASTSTGGGPYPCRGANGARPGT